MFGNTGTDIYIKALGRLDHYMKVRSTTFTLLGCSEHDLKQGHAVFSTYFVIQFSFNLTDVLCYIILVIPFHMSVMLLHS